jgi:hypothetical protein
MVLAGLGGRFTASCDGLGWIVGLVRVLAGDSDSRLNDSLDLEGPSFAATTPRLSKNFLNSYLAGETPSEYWQWGDVSGVNVFFTSNVFLEVTIPFLFDHVRRWRVPDLIRIIDGIGLDVSHIFHGLTKRS